MKRVWNFFCLLIFASVALSFAPPAAAEPQNPGTVVRQLIDSIRRLPSADSPEARSEIVRQADSALNLQVLAQRALGDTWDGLSRSDRKEFIELLTRMMETIAYPRAARFFSGLEVEYSDPEVDGKTRIVHTTMTRSEGGAVTIDYVLNRTSGRFQISDILLEGESLSAKVAEQIQAIIKRTSYKDLVDKMRGRLERAPKQEADGERS